MLRSTWLIPILVALTSVAGLIGALTGDGMRDLFAWIALAVPVAATLWAHLARQRHVRHKGMN
ncbi:MAG TPA: hypothetical protein VF637_00480 [Sphingomicrobium sp.]